MKTETVHVTTPTDTEILMTRSFDAPRRLVWEAWVTPEHLQKWMLGPEGWSMPVCEIDLRPGGKWHYVWRRANGNEFGMTGVFKEVTPPERLVNTEKWGPEWPETLITTTFEEKDGRTTVRQTCHYPSKDVRDKALATGMVDGVNVSFDRLDKVLAVMAG
jgi:uncharacterized protein YndB with AHSA1/START domain